MNNKLDDVFIDSISNFDRIDEEPADPLDVSSAHPRGQVIIRNPATGNIINSNHQENLVLFRGRLHTLQMLTGLDLADGDVVSGVDESNTWNLNYNSTKKIALFSAGNGGSVEGNPPTDLVSPEWSDWYLKKPVPFVVSSDDSGLPRANTYFLKDFMPNNESAQPINDIVANGYYGKTFNTAPKLVVDSDKNVAYLSIRFSIDTVECRGYIVNEIALLLAEVVAGTPGDWENTFQISEPPTGKIECFSKYTMNPKDFTEEASAYRVEYRIYV